MSRRMPNPSAERAAQNQQTIKTLLKLEGNKTCADCKKRNFPRWASWNLGIFICIRCSGIHRGMGTHISRVKSVDLDAWTDEQLQSVLRWGNSRANKYWEAKLAEGHTPSEAKIENFIRTKYDSKRWTMDGPMPDPETLDDEGDDNVPLNVVQEKAKLERSSSQQKPLASPQPSAPTQKAVHGADIFGDLPSPPARPSTTDTPGTRPSPGKSSGAPKQPDSGNSLLGLDFFGGPPSVASSKPSSISSPPVSSGPSRPDLKQSILSLYAAAPRTQSQPQPQHERQSSFGGMQSPPVQPSAAPQQSNFGGMNDAFSSLSFTSTTSPPPPKAQQPAPNPFAAFDKPANQRSTIAAPQITSPHSSGGGFFDTSPKPAVKPNSVANPPNKPAQAPLSFGVMDMSSLSTNTSSQPTTATRSNLNDLFDFSNPPKEEPTQKHAVPSPQTASAFNLSAPTPSSQAPTKPTATSASTNAFSNFSNVDPWGSSDAWATPEPSNDNNAAKTKTTKKPSITAPNDFSGWGSVPPSISTSTAQGPPKIAADEDFGGWNSAAPAPSAMTKPPASSGVKPAGGYGGGSEDLFSNVWE